MELWTYASYIHAVIASSILSATVMAHAASAPGGTVHFKGQIVNAACAVSADSADQTVNLGQWLCRIKVVSGNMLFFYYDVTGTVAKIGR